MINQSDIYNWLGETDPDRLTELWELADDVRGENVGDEVHLRGLLEFSNRCVRPCAYCGLRAENRDLQRYRMTPDEILACARKATELGYGTVVFQSGQDQAMTGQWLAEIIERITEQLPLAITLSVGERTAEEFALWRRAGAGRYLLRFETSDPALYDLTHPGLDGGRLNRFTILHTLRRLGYELGSGVMVGIPGQSFRTLARDIEMFAKLDLDMIGSGPFIPTPNTPLGENSDAFPPAERQVPNDELMSYKVIALTRLICPQANIPTTTAVATLDGPEAYELGLRRGANVIMPNITPPEYRRLYAIYPDKAGVNQDDDYHERLKKMITAVGRRIGVGRGDSPNYRRVSKCAL